MADKRDINRLKKRVPVKFGVEDATRSAFSEDISGTGMFIRTPNICVPNSKIKVEFMLNDANIQLDARVMWAKKVPANMFHLVKKCGMGIRFLRINSGEEALQAFLEQGRL